MDVVALLLTTSFRHVINEPNIESGYARFNEVAAEPIDETAFRNAVAAALRDKLIREPIRLPEGALQCHWHLELTPKGVELARVHLSRAAGEVAERSDAGEGLARGTAPSPGASRRPLPQSGRGVPTTC